MSSPQGIQTNTSAATPAPPFSRRAAGEVGLALAVAVAVSVALNVLVVQVTEVRERSMDPTLAASDRVLVSKVDYRFVLPQRNDIIVFNPPRPSRTTPYVKRVIAIGGDRVDLRSGNVFVNGQLVQTPGARGETVSLVPSVSYPFTVPAGEVFVMGDNRAFSTDSRAFGSVPIDTIIGKVILRLWPLDRLTFYGW